MQCRLLWSAQMTVLCNRWRHESRPCNRIRVSKYGGLWYWLIPIWKCTHSSSLSNLGGKTCDVTWGNLFAWRKLFDQLFWRLVASQVVRAYLQNRGVDFVHFRQADRYDWYEHTCQNSAQSPQYLRHESVFLINMTHLHNNNVVTIETNGLSPFLQPSSTFLPSLVPIGP